VSRPTDVEISRALNALAMTLRERRVRVFDTAEARAILTGALGGEAKLDAVATATSSGEIRRSEDGRLVATVELRRGRWNVERELLAGESDWAIPQPAHDQKET
jgi:plasmid stability protein